MRTVLDVVQTFAAKGLRATPQRIAIYETLLSRKDHPTAEVLYHDIHARYPSISRNTVYTTLESLKRAGLIQRIDVGHSACHYDGNPKAHAHIVCTVCQRVDDIPVQVEPITPTLMCEVAQSSRYIVDFGTTCFYGRCPNCSGNLMQ